VEKKLNGKRMIIKISDKEEWKYNEHIKYFECINCEKIVEIIKNNDLTFKHFNNCPFCRNKIEWK
jgi:hypothetical protein